MARLKDWTVTGSVTVDGETRVLQLTGAVYRHRCYADGVVITTSRLVEFDPSPDSRAPKTHVSNWAPAQRRV